MRNNLLTNLFISYSQNKVNPHKSKSLFLRYSLANFLIISVFSFLMPACSHESDSSSDRIMPGGTVPVKLTVLELDPSLSWEERNMLSCFQGLINRIKTRIYYIETEHDEFWLEYYSKEFGIEYEKISSVSELLELYANEIEGYITYDSNNPHSLNIATTEGAIKNLLPVAGNLEEFINNLGLKDSGNVELNTTDRIKIYENALNEFLPECNKGILAALCVHHPHWPTSTVKNRDYIIANNIFSFDLSSSERDKSDYELIKEIYGRMNEGTIIMGWHCVRDKEHEAIGLASQFGHFGMCNLHTPNLTVHSSVPIDRNRIFNQRKLSSDQLVVEDKIYIAFMATDGDASWFMNDLVNKDWADPAHGKFKYNWGFLPLAFDIMPGTVKYYLENMKETDYFVAGPAGATYTYPYLHPDPTKFLKLSDDYMKKCGLTTVHMTNWNDRDWWQEVDIPNFREMLDNHLPGSIGYVRGMGESAFEKHYLGNGKPYIFCGEGIHRGDDVYKTMKDFIDACPNRPLFIYSLVNHSIPIGEIKEAMDKFTGHEIEIVHLDELLLLADKAYNQGKITSDLYPVKKGIIEIMMKEAKKSWPIFIKKLSQIKEQSEGNEKRYKSIIENTPAGVEPIVAGDHLAFTTIWNSMTLIKLALESQGHYVNNKSKAVEEFLEVFESMKNKSVVEDLHIIWKSWQDKTISFTQAKKLTSRLNNLANELDAVIMK